MGWYDKSQAELADAFARWYAAYHEPWDSGFSCWACAMGKDSRAGHQFRLATCFVTTPAAVGLPGYSGVQRLLDLGIIHRLGLGLYQRHLCLVRQGIRKARPLC